MRKSVRLLSLIFAFSLLQTLSLPAIAVSSSEPINSPESYQVLTVDDGVLTNSDAYPIQVAIDDYFSFRQDSYDNAQVLSAQTRNINSPTLTEPETASLSRNISLKNFWENQDVDIVSIESEASIVAAEQHSQTGDVRLMYMNGLGSSIIMEMALMLLRQIIWGLQPLIIW